VPWRRAATKGSSYFFRRLCADSLWQESGWRAKFALANAGGSLPIILERRQIKSPNSGSRTPRNSQKTKNRTQLKSPKNSILQNQKSRRNRIIDRESQRISNRLARRGEPARRLLGGLAQCALYEGFGMRKHISKRLAQSAFCEGFGVREHISNRFCTTNRIRCNSFKTKDRDISNRF
jgi:hypothetical protein